MDVGELLSYKPEFAIKPTSADAKSSLADKNASGNPRKRSRLDVSHKPYSSSHTKDSSHSQRRPTHSAAHSQNGQEQASTAQEQQHVEEQNKMIEEKLEEFEKENDGTSFDESEIKKMVLNFEKRVLKNQELRIKFPDDPKKFMESEIELNDGIEELHVLATVPDQYPLLVDLGVIRTLLSLLSHENTDISIAVVDLLQEMTDIEDSDESEGAEALIDALVEGQVVATLVHNIQRLDETQKSESQGVHNTLGIIENMTEIRPEVSSEVGPGGLLAWILKRLKAKMPFDANKLYASEILAIVTQSNVENQGLIGSMDGIDVLLQQLAQYKRHDPTSSEEQEMMENLFDTLCSCLLLPSNREPFLQGEGLQLMNLMLREKKLSRNGALRVLDHALTAPEGADNCNKLVDILGLRTIFPLFMKTPSKHGKRGLSKEQHEEHVISIISWLLRNCRSNQRQRLINKFTENDHEKVDRLLELHFKYLEKVLTTNNLLEEQAREENLEEDEMYLRRLDGGLFTLQLVDYIMLDICATGPPSIKRRVLKILNVRNASIKTIKNIIREYASNLGNDSDSEKNSLEQERILQLLDKFQNM